MIFLISDKWAFTAYWVAWEYCHFNWDLAFPWLTLGNALAHQIYLIQWYEYTGALGGSLWILGVNVLTFRLLCPLVRLRLKRGLVYLSMLITLPILLSLSIWFSLDYSPSLRIEVVSVHPNTERYRLGLPEDSPIVQLYKTLELARPHITPHTALILLPETAIQMPCYIELLAESQPMMVIRAWLHQFPQAKVVTGAILQEKTQDKYESTYVKWANTHYKLHNSVIQLDTSQVIPIRSKVKLSFYEERFPFWLEPFESMIVALGGEIWRYTPRNKPEPQIFRDETTGIGYTPILCYEGAFYEFTAQKITAKSQFITIGLNEGWFRQSEGTYQNTEFLRVMAVCMRRSIARSSNMGISGFYTPKGEITQTFDKLRPKVLREQVILNEKVTFYSTWGDYIGKIALMLGTFWIALMLYHRLRGINIPL
jgi:apolipoprotein N-acyltransferase